MHLNVLPKKSLRVSSELTTDLKSVFWLHNQLHHRWMDDRLPFGAGDPSSLMNETTKVSSKLDLFEILATYAEILCLLD